MRLLSNTIKGRGAVFGVVVVCLFSLPVYSQPWDGSGTAEDPYQIWTAEDMQAIGADSVYWDAHFELMANINLGGYTGTSFNIIGSNPYWPTEGTAFTGVFNGNDHTISNFTYSSSGEGNIGVFGYVEDPSAEIKDLGLVNPDVDTGTGVNVGALVGDLSRGTVSGCYVEGGSVSGEDYVGGLVGYNYYGTITNCYSTGNVSGNYSVGGLVGHNEEKITNCYAAGSVSGIDNVGGLVGTNTGTITNSYASGSVSGVNWVGGLAGVSSAIMNCYSAGSVVGGSGVGGLVGYTSRSVVGSFWDIQTSGQTTSAGGEGKTTAQMKDANTYLYWGCGSVWTINAGVDYPRLVWENLPGEVLDAELSDFVAGAGTESDPYLIYTAQELNTIGLFWCEWDKQFKLMADIDLSAYTGTSFNIIGAGWDNPFTGVFDGNGHTISNFTYTSPGTNNIGLFGVVREAKAEIKDLGLIDPNVDAGTGDYVGSLVGAVTGGRIGSTMTEGGRISGCYVEGGSVSGNVRVGGLVGRNYEGTITDCYSTGSVSGGGTVGGLVGENYGYGYGVITNCYSTGSVVGTGCIGGLVGWSSGGIYNSYSTASITGTGSYVGGLVGYNNHRASITNCYAIGSVSGVDKVGGLVGYNKEAGSGTAEVEAAITNSYSAGSVSGTADVGGLVGSGGGLVTDSFWDTQTSGQATSSGGMGKTTAQMEDTSTFLAVGWDFVGEYGNGPSDHWAEPPGGGYMILWYQLSPLPPLPAFSGGTGAAGDPYILSTAAELNRIGSNSRLMDKHFRLIDDIDLTGVDFFFIGNRGYGYSGVFDGNGHTISNFTYTSTATDYIGVFGYVDGQDAEIKELGLIDPNIAAGTGTFVGSLVGYIGNGTISGCYVDGGSVSGGVAQWAAGVGGLVGYNLSGAIADCRAVGSVSGESSIGGLAGNNDGTITNCYSAGSVMGTGASIGGLVGKNNSGTISDSNSAGSVSGGDSVGGLVGFGGTITNCYSTAVVTGNDRVGGLVGYGGATNCYSTADVTGNEQVGGLVGAGGATNCYSASNVTGTTYVGGLVGSGGATNCYSKGSVSGENIVGGLVGRNPRNRTISNCYAWGSVEGVEDVGGLVGFNYGDVADCYARGEVTGVLDVGGLVGENGYYSDIWATYWGTVANCYAAGPITGTVYVGGLLGNNDGEVAGSFWDVNNTGPSNMCGRVGAHGSGCDNGNGKTTVQMQMASTFTSAGWDFVLVWDICEGTNYPKLVWQIPIAGDFNCPDGVDGIDLGLLCEYWLFEELSADVAPNGGDGFVNFLDWAIFAEGWQTTHDIFDLAVFADQWLGRVLLADVWPDGSDLFVDFSDWALFADAWQSTPESPNWNRRCDIAPAGGDEIVDMDDIVVFMQQWLTAGSYYHHLDADIAPAPDGDGIVNMLDFATLANNWLE